MTAGPSAGLTELAAKLARGAVSAREAVSDTISRLETLHAATNAVAELDAEGALAAAAEVDARWSESGPAGPLHGVPFTVKDWIDAIGFRCCGGAVEHRQRRPDRDATVVARLRAAGAVLVAKTAVQVDSDLHGIVRNPHDADRSPGASSSGEAAVVGGGASPLGLASDSGGSIRVPAAWCGATGHKPGAGVVSLAGHFPRIGDRNDGRTQIGPVTPSPRDAALVLRVIAGPDGRDPAVAPVAWRDPVDDGLSALRIGWLPPAAEWRPSQPVMSAVTAALATLETAGCRLAGEFDFRLDESLDITRRYWRRDLLTGAEADRHLRDWDGYRWSMLAKMADFDAVVLPAVAGVAPTHRPMTEEDYVFTLPASLTGWPATAVPAGFAGALPVGVQVVAGPWRDDVALRVADVIHLCAR